MREGGRRGARTHDQHQALIRVELRIRGSLIAKTSQKSKPNWKVLRKSYLLFKKSYSQKVLSQAGTLYSGTVCRRIHDDLFWVRIASDERIRIFEKMTLSEDTLLFKNMTFNLQADVFCALIAGTSPRGVRPFCGCTDCHMNSCVYCA